MYVWVLLITFVLVYMFNTAYRKREAPKGSFYMLLSLTCFCFGLFFEYYQKMFLFTLHLIERLSGQPKITLVEYNQRVSDHLMKNQLIYLHVRLYFFIMGSIYLKSLLERFWDIHKLFEAPRPPKKS
jgi:hypothetical protein